jgi:hemolysin III
MKIQPHFYSKKEELINVVTHAGGFVFSCIGLVFLLIKAFSINNSVYVLSFSVFGISMVVLYLASTLYHSSKNKKLRYRLNILDHAAIYLLIAGTYTPFALIVLSGTLGWVLFFVVWAFASVGVVLKLFFTGRFKLISTIMYVLMGWLVIFVIQPLWQNFPPQGIYWLFTGGAFYTAGAVLFMIDKLKYNHAIFHFFVLAGSLSHYFAVYFYVNPASI